MVLSNSRSVSGMYFIIEAKSASFAGEISLSKHYLQDLRRFYLYIEKLNWHDIFFLFSRTGRSSVCKLKLFLTL